MYLSFKHLRDREIIIGVTIINCAIIIMFGEYRRSIKPKTPDEENIIYNINPTTTGGKLINELKISVIASLPKKFLIAI